MTFSELQSTPAICYESGMQILITEDHEHIAASLQQGLTESGYTTDWSASGAETLQRLNQTPEIDLLILDLGLPDMDGMEVLKRIRAINADLPILILTARSEVEDRVKGLTSGADDYLTKPFAFAELLARIQVMERRTSAPANNNLKLADLELDPIARTAARAGDPIELTPKEFDLLMLLANHAGQAVSREMMAEKVWHITSRAVPFDNIIDVNISNLRKKIDADHELKLIRTLRGVGFTMRADA